MVMMIMHFFGIIMKLVKFVNLKCYGKMLYHEIVIK